MIDRHHPPRSPSAAPMAGDNKAAITRLCLYDEASTVIKEKLMAVHAWAASICSHHIGSQDQIRLPLALSVQLG